MKKMPCMFVREFRDKGSFTITEQVTPGCEWVANPPQGGYVAATAKYDGTACLVRDGELWRRYDAKRGKVPPDGAIPCTGEPDAVTGHWPHWVRVSKDNPADKWHVAAWEAERPDDDGTYELIGPHFQGNPHRADRDLFMPHGCLANVPLPIWYTSQRLTLASVRDAMERCDVEGIVFYRYDSNTDKQPSAMCKIRRDDFGLPWPIPEVER